MRKSLKTLIEKSIVFEYELPCSRNNISRSKISTQNDFCYSVENNEDLAEVIYNAVIDYAFNEYEITESDFDTLHRRALTRKLKFNEEAPDEQKIKYGFYGEVILYCMLYIFHKASPIIARGHFYQILENGETKGYDAYHLIDNCGEIELWFGEVKFYSAFNAATTGPNGAITNLKKVLSDKYLASNLIAICERQNDLSIRGSALNPILRELRDTNDVKISELSMKYSIKLVYPILILFDSHRDGYDPTIERVVKHIEDVAEELSFDLSVSVSLFFMLVPVKSSKDIKLKVLEWIRDKKPLML